MDIVHTSDVFPFSDEFTEQLVTRNAVRRVLKGDENPHNWETLALGQSTLRNDLMTVLIMAFVIAVLLLLSFWRPGSRR